MNTSSIKESSRNLLSTAKEKLKQRETQKNIAIAIVALAVFAAFAVAVAFCPLAAGIMLIAGLGVLAFGPVTLAAARALKLKLSAKTEDRELLLGSQS